MEDVWLMLLQPHSELITREVSGHSEARGPEMSRSLLNVIIWFKNSMISLIHLACQCIETLCTTLNFSPILNLTTDANIGCLQLSQQK